MPNRQPLVSIIIANFNNGNFIKNCIESVVNQTYTNWEVIIVDDASTDDSWMMIQQLIKTYPNIYGYRNDRNLKVGATKAKATSLAKGEICGILDPDDALEPTALEKHVALYKKHPDCSLVSSNYYHCDEQLNIKEANQNLFEPKKYYSYLASKGGIHHFWSFNKYRYSLTKGFEAKFILAEDQDLFYKLEEVGKVFVLDNVLYYYRIHSKALSQGNKVALAYAYHILAQYNALKRRRPHRLEVEAVKNTLLNYLDWGLIKIEKPLRISILYRGISLFPELILSRRVQSAIYHLLR